MSDNMRHHEHHEIRFHKRLLERQLLRLNELTHGSPKWNECFRKVQELERKVQELERRVGAQNANTQGGNLISRPVLSSNSGFLGSSMPDAFANFGSLGAIDNRLGFVNNNLKAAIASLDNNVFQLRREVQSLRNGTFHDNAFSNSSVITSSTKKKKKAKNNAIRANSSNGNNGNGNNGNGNRGNGNNGNGNGNSGNGNNGNGNNGNRNRGNGNNGNRNRGNGNSGNGNRGNANCNSTSGNSS